MKNLLRNRSNKALISLLLVCLLLTNGLLTNAFAQEGGQEGWWMSEPIRWVQTNLRQVDATLDARRLAEQLADMRANVVLMGMGGIAAYYPTEVHITIASPGSALPGATCSAT